MVFLEKRESLGPLAGHSPTGHCGVYHKLGWRIVYSKHEDGSSRLAVW